MLSETEILIKAHGEIVRFITERTARRPDTQVMVFHGFFCLRQEHLTEVVEMFGLTHKICVIGGQPVYQVSYFSA